MNVFELMGSIELRDENFIQGVNNARRTMQQLQAAFNTSTNALDRSVQQSMNATGRSANRGAQQVEHASSDMSESLDEVGDSMDNAARSADENFERIGNAAEEGGDQVSRSSQEARQDVENSTNQLSASVIAKAQIMAQAITGAIKAAASGAKNLIQGTVEAYSSYEQNIGGVAKLYGVGGQSIQQYAASVGKSVTDVTAEYGKLSDAQKLVVKNAKQAYKTAGMDANTYMENATQFSASLINSLGGDTVKAAEQTDKAMRLISDNVNTFGSNTEDVSNAIKGLSRENFSMLDNLKLGYSGTKEGMQQLVADANEYGKTIGMTKELSMDSFSDMIDAIQLIQQKQGIAGTTAREAATTIEGSLNMTKAAWSNLLTTLGSGEGTEDAFRALLESAGKFASNVKPVIGRALEGMGQVLLEEGPKLVVGLADGIANGIPEAIPKVIEVVKSIGEKFGEHTDELKSAGKKLLEGLLTGISEATGIDIDVSAITGIFGKIGELGGGALDSVVGLFQKAGPPVAEFVGALIDLGSTITGQVLTALQSIAPVLEPIISGIGDFGSAILDKVVGLFQKAGPPVAEFVGTIINLASTITGHMLTALQSIAPVFEPIISGIIDFGSTILDMVLPALQGLGEFLSENSEIIGTVVAAIGGGVAAFMAIQGAIKAVTIVVGALSAAQTVLNTVMAAGQAILNTVMEANPIGIIIVAIGALVAAFIYLWNNSEEFRQFFIELWENIKEVVVTVWEAITSALSAAWEWISTTASTVFGAIGDFFTGLWEGIKSTAESVWNGISSFLSSVWEGIKSVVSTVVNVISTIISTYFNIYKTIITTVFNAIKTVVTTVWNGISTAITTVVTTIQNVISTGFNAVKTVVSTVFNAVKTAIEKPFKAAYDTVKGIVNKLKSIFNFSWKLPDIQVPKFKIDGGEFPYGLGGKGRFPNIDILWHAKAMNAPMLLTKPTIFGMMGDKYLAGGEAGPEVVSGVNPLLNMMRNAASSGNGRRDAMLSMIVELLSQYLPEINTGQDPEALFQAFDRRLGEAMI